MGPGGSAVVVATSAVMTIAAAAGTVAGWAVLVNRESIAAASGLGCLRLITAVVADRLLENAPTVCGVALLGASGVAAVLAGALDDVEMGSVLAGAVAADSDETAEELVCGAPPLATETPGASERVRLASPAGARPDGVVEAAGDDTRLPELLRAFRPGVRSGLRNRPGSLDVDDSVADLPGDVAPACRGGLDDDSWEEELALESAGAAHATAVVLAHAIPAPIATANAPT